MHFLPNVNMRLPPLYPNSASIPECAKVSTPVGSKTKRKAWGPLKEIARMGQETPHGSSQREKDLRLNLSRSVDVRIWSRKASERADVCKIDVCGTIHDDPRIRRLARHRVVNAGRRWWTESAEINPRVAVEYEVTIGAMTAWLASTTTKLTRVPDGCSYCKSECIRPVRA